MSSLARTRCKSQESNNAAEFSNPTGARLLARQQRQLEQQRTRAQKRLADARERLERLGWRGRRQHSAELKAEIAFNRNALQLADEKLTELTLGPPRSLQPPAPARHGRELARARSRQPQLEREPPGLGLER